MLTVDPNLETECHSDHIKVGNAVKFAAMDALCDFYPDFVDGKLARKYNLVSNFGKFMDPLADKLLVCTALICFIQLDWIPAYMAVIIIAREFIVTGLRTLAASKGIVMAAIMTGKVKTVLQMIAILCTMVFSFVEFEICGYPWIGFVTMAISTLFTIYSGYEYIARNVNLIKEM